MQVHIPRNGFNMDALSQLGFAVFCLGFTGAWTSGAIRGGAPILFAMFSLPFWGVGVSVFLSSLKMPLMSMTLAMGTEHFEIYEEPLGIVTSSVKGRVIDLSGPPVRSCDGDACSLLFEQ